MENEREGGTRNKEQGSSLSLKPLERTSSFLVPYSSFLVPRSSFPTLFFPHAADPQTARLRLYQDHACPSLLGGVRPRGRAAVAGSAWRARGAPRLSAAADARAGREVRADRLRSARWRAVEDGGSRAHHPGRRTSPTSALSHASWWEIRRRSLAIRGVVCWPCYTPSRRSSEEARSDPLRRVSS